MFKWTLNGIKKRKLRYHIQSNNSRKNAKRKRNTKYKAQRKDALNKAPKGVCNKRYKIIYKIWHPRRRDYSNLFTKYFEDALELCSIIIDDKYVIAEEKIQLLCEEGEERVEIEVLETTDAEILNFHKSNY